MFKLRFATRFGRVSRGASRPIAGSIVALSVALGAAAASAKANEPALVDSTHQTARDAYFHGDIGRALVLAESTGERWIGGLAAYRLKNYAQAADRFAALARDPQQTEWVRAAGGFWAARAATAAGDSPGAKMDLELAASHPRTFYGLIAARRLEADAGGADPAHAPRLYSASMFPTPVLAPKGGFTLSKALVYALVRQESRFNASAVGGGAHGLMQLTPATASRLSGDSGFTRNPSRLHEAGINLRLGQDYVGKILASVQGDLMRAMAAYNQGPSILKKLGDPADTLMMVESLPGASTREFVKKVMTNYWIYRGIFGLASPSLDAAASDSRPVLASLDD